MTNIQQLNYKLNKQVKKAGLVSTKVKVQEFDDAEYNVSAGINPQNWAIEVNVKSGYNPIQDSRQKAYAKVKKIQDGLETIVLQVGSLHEVAHWELPFGSGKGCPFDVYNHDKILEGVKNGLPENKKQHTSYVANMFEDTIINPRCKEYNGDFSGQILFWDGEGLRVEKKTGQKGFGHLYEAFVKVNLHLFGDKYDKSFLKRHYGSDNILKKAANKITGKDVDSVVKQIVNDLALPENIQDTTQFFNKSEWPSMAEKYAKAISKLIEEQLPQERLSAYDSGQQNKDGQGKEKPQAGNGIEQKVNSKEGKQEIAYGRYASGDKQSPNFESFEQLDSLYQRLAKDIPVKVEAITRDSNLEISPLTYRAFDSEKDDIRKIKTSKLFFNEKGIQLAYPNHPLTIDYKSKIQRKSFPSFKMVVIDNSGSMKDDPNGGKNIGSTNFIPWGDNSRYHFALKGYYGIENFLQKQGISPYIQHGVSLFSSNTRFKIGDYNELINIRKLLLSPDWGSTNLDAGALKQALQGKESFLLSLSDGDISNWDSEKAEIKKLIENNYYAHIQLGSDTNFSRDLKSWGVPVEYVNSGQDLSKLMVNITKKAYHPFVQENKK